MHRLVAVGLFMAGLMLAINTLPAAEEPGFVQLFDGKTLEGWTVKSDKPNPPEGEWLVKDGLLTAKSGHSWLSTKEAYGDFVLKLEWRVPVNGNSGVFVHVPDLKVGEHPHVKGIEIQILDNDGPEFKGKLQPYQYTASIYGAVPATNSTYKGAGEWNEYEITNKGNLLTVVMNGKKVAEADVEMFDSLKTRPRKGYLGLQNHGTAVDFRNIRVKALD